MSFKKIYDICVPVASYQTKDGQNKKRWRNIGSVFEGDNGAFMVFDAFFNPASVPREPGKENITLSLYKPKEQQNTTQQSSTSHEFDDDIPF